MKNQWLSPEGRFSLFRLPEAFRCRPAILLLLGGMATAVLLQVLAGMAFNTPVLLALLSLLALAAFLVSVNAAGVALTTHAHGRDPLPVIQYLLAGLFSIPRFIGAMILLSLAYAALMIAGALILFICKLPGLGALLLVVAVPLLVYVFGATIISLYLASAVILPALWAGEGVLTSIRAVYTIVRRYPIQALTKVILGTLAASLFASLLGGLVAIGSLVVAGLGAGVLGVGDFTAIGSIFFGGRSSHGSSTLMGAVAGFAVTYAIAGTFVMALFMKVGVLTWAEFSEKISLEDLRQDTEAKWQETREKAKSAAQAAKNTTSSMAQTATAKVAGPADQGDTRPVSSQTQVCPQCSATVSAEDIFCGSCGHRLRGG